MGKSKDEDVLDTAGVADMFDVNAATVRRWAEAGRLIGRRLAKGKGSWVFTGKNVREFMERDELERNQSKGGRPRGRK